MGAKRMVKQSRVVTLELPWPPSVNTYWRRCGARYFVSKKGKDFRDEVYFLCHKSRNNFATNARLEVYIEAYPPDNRRRDLDNILKSLLDALQFGGIYEDDSQIDRIHIIRKASKEAKVVVEVRDYQSVLN